MKSTIGNGCMLLAIFCLVMSSLLVAPLSVQAVPTLGDIMAVRILEDGWSAEIDVNGFKTGGVYDFGLGPDNSPTNSKIVFTVTSQGYDENGNLGTITRTVYGTKWVRKTYPDSIINSHVPNERELDGILTVRVSLSDFIYIDDKNGGTGTSGTDVGVSIASGWYMDSGANGTGLPNNGSVMTAANNSTVAYPKVVGRWAWPGYERVTGDFLVEASAFNRFAKDNKPVAKVVFHAEDEHGNTYETSTGDLVISSRGGDANPVLVYQGIIPVANFYQDDVITVNFTAYPWVGDSSSIINSGIGFDGAAQPSEALGPLNALNDKNGTYGVGYVQVSPSGSDTTGTAYGTQAQAEAGNAYRTIEKAAEGLKNYHAANFGRNNAGAGVILLAAGNHAFPGVSTVDLGAMETWLTIKPMSTASKANTIISSTSGQSFKGTHLKVEGLTLSSPGTVLTARAASDALWLHDNEINLSSQAAIAYFKAAYATNNHVTNLKNGFASSGSNTPFAIIRGNVADNPTSSSFYAVLGNKNITGAAFAESNNNRGGLSDNSIFAFNSIYRMSNTLNWARSSQISKGMAIVQNLFESTSTGSFAILFLSSDTPATTSNIMIWHNTFVGQREGLSYNSVGSDPYYRTNWSEKYNIYEELGKKTDTFSGTTGPNGNRIGNWSVIHNAGSIGNFIVKNAFMADFDGVYSKAKRTSTIHLDPEYVDNRSTTGSGLGNGDYQLRSSSTAIDMSPLSMQFGRVLPHDLLGYPRTGDPDAGAYEYQAVADTAAPTLSNGSPVGTLPENTAQTTLNVTTDEQATCKYGTVPNAPYASLSNTFLITGGTSHSASVSGLSNGASYDYYLKCQDAFGNFNTMDYQVSFAVASSSDTVAPRVTSINYMLNGRMVDITLTFSEAVTSTSASLNTNTDGSCAFSISNSSSVLCSYQTGVGENLAGFHVVGFTGTITDSAGNAVAPFSAAAWLNQNSAF
jgi:hypothetical protein